MTTLSTVFLISDITKQKVKSANVEYKAPMVSSMGGVSSHKLPLVSSQLAIEPLSVSFTLPSCRYPRAALEWQRFLAAAHPDAPGCREDDKTGSSAQRRQVNN